MKSPFSSSASAQRKAGVVLGYVNIVVKNLVSLMYTPMLLAYVGQGDYGVFEMANSTVYSLTILSFGFAGAYVRFYTQRAETGDEAGVRRLNGMYLLLYSVISLVALAGGLFFSANVEAFFSEGLTAAEIVLAGKIMAVMSVNVAITLFTNVFNSYITALERFSYQQSRQTLTTLATPLLSLTFLHFGFGAVGVACAQVIMNAVLLVLNIVYSVRILGMRFEFRERERGLFKALAVFSGWLFMNQICDLVNNNVPNILLGALASSAAVAVFAIAVKIKNIFISLSTTLSNVFVPKVNQIVFETDDNMELTRLMTRVGRYQMMLLCYILGGFVVLGQWFVAAWAGEEYSQAYWMVVVMVTPNLVPLSQNVGIEIQRAKNMHQARSIVYICGAAVNVALTALFARSLGCWAPVIGYDIQVVLGTGVWMNWYYHRRVGLDMGYYWRRCLPVVLVTACVTAACLAGTALLPVTGIVAFLAWGVIYSLCFVALAWRLLLTDGERGALVGRLRRMAGGA